MRSSDPQNQSTPPANKQTILHRAMLLFGVMGFVAVAVVEVFYFNLLRSSGAWQYTALLIVNGALGIGILINALVQLRTKNPMLAAWGMIILVNLTFPAASIFISGLSILFAVGGFIFTAIFALQGLSRSQVRVALIFGAFFIPINLLAEFGLRTFERVPIGVQVQQVLVIVIGAVVLFYGMHLIAQAEFKSMRTQFNLTYLLAVIVPSLIIGIPSVMYTKQILAEKAVQSLQSGGARAAAQVETFLRENLSSIQADAGLPSVIGFLKGEETIQEAEDTLLALGSTRTDIKAYLIFDADGNKVFDTSEEQTHTESNEALAPYFIEAVQTRQAYASDVLFEPQNGAAELYFSAPILDNESGRILGVLAVEMNASALQDLLISVSGSSTYSILVDDNHTILASGGDEAFLYKTTRPLTPGQVAELQIAHRLPPGLAEAQLLDLPGLEDGLAQSASTSFTLELEADDASPGDDQAVLTPLQSKPWTVVTLEPGEVFLQPFYDQLRVSFFLLAFLFVGAGVLANLAAGMLISPIRQLTRAAEKIKAGDLSARSAIERQDEIGILAQTVDQTAGQLAATLQGLEQRVAERTYDLEMSRLQSEERSRNLLAISEVSRAISTEQHMEVLLPLITRTVSEKFDFYHTGIFLLDPTRTYAVLQAANSAGGRRMLARGHRLQVGQTGIVGNVAQTGKPRIALDVGADSTFANNPDLPETHSEMALPLSIRGEVIGVLDVQSTRHGAFTENDAAILSIMADQIAIAIENARLLERTQQALNEVQSMYSQYLRQEWKGFAQLNQNIGYYQSISGGRLLDKPMQTGEILQALERGEVAVLEGESAERPTIVMPVKLRGEVLGVLNIVSLQPERRWAKEEIALVQTASDRLALALENARLLQESLRRAERERKVSEITSHIRSTNDPNEMIRLAVQELKNALGVNRIEVLPQSVASQTDAE